MTDRTPPLGPLPEPRTLSRGDEDGAIQLGYTAAQMRSYALQERAAERERWATHCDYFADGMRPKGHHEAAAAFAKLGELMRAEPGKDAP